MLTKYYILLSVIIYSFSYGAEVADNAGGNAVNEKFKFIKEIYSESWALIIGINKYQNVDHLQFAVNDAKKIKSLLVEQYGFPKGNIRYLIDKEATKNNVLDSICNYDLIYFATHGISNSENPLENSFLVLSESDDSSAYFSLSEIMNIRKECSLHADLVVLSACQTGLGKSHEGGIIGLARSFQIAGANHVVMSLWNIDDEKTATFMSFFFEELRKSNDLMPHEALRQATLRFKSEIDNDPKYWAAFSIFGVPY